MTEDEEFEDKETRETDFEDKEPEEIDDQEPEIKPEDIGEPEPSEEPCDPVTMDCDQMRDHIMELADERIQHKNAINNLKSAKETIEDENLDKIITAEEEKLKKVDDEIYGTFEKFSVCTTKPVKKEEENSEE